MKSVIAGSICHTRNCHAHIVHNPKAGDQHHIKEELVRRVQSKGFTCRYASIKEKGWKRFKKGTALVVVAGGDGTVREVLKKVLSRTILDKPLTIALLPSGTANNFAKSLKVSSDLEAFERRIANPQPKPIDIGAVISPRDARFFIEGLGFGLIPELIQQMKSADLGKVTAGKELDLALAKLLEIVETYAAKRATVTIDGQVYENDYLLVEVLNIRSIGPNLVLAPDADPTDGKFEVVMLKQSDRKVFSAYLRRLMQSLPNEGTTVPWQIVAATREVIIDCDNRTIHVDDELITIKRKKKIEIAIRPGIVNVIA